MARRQKETTVLTHNITYLAVAYSVNFVHFIFVGTEHSAKT